MKVNHRISRTEKRIKRVRAKVRGTTERPRLSVYRSNRSIYLQVIDDSQGKTLAAVKSEQKKKVTKTDAAKVAAEALTEKLKKAKIAKLVFDRGGYQYHGRVQAIAETMRAAKIEV